jgi:hypothetical protein
MSTTAQEVLKAFESLSEAGQHQVAAEILRRTAKADDIPDAALDELAAELFRNYDAEESVDADRSAR